jgi:hypothetical protein
VTALIDTSFFFAPLDAGDRNHEAADHLARTNPEERIMLSSVLPEATYLISTRLGYSTAIRFVRSLAVARLRYEWVLQSDLMRVAEIMETYADARLDLVDCTLMAAAERLNISRIWTFDRRDFGMVKPRHMSYFTLLP